MLKKNCSTPRCCFKGTIVGAHQSSKTCYIIAKFLGGHLPTKRKIVEKFVSILANEHTNTSTHGQTMQCSLKLQKLRLAFQTLRASVNR